jgi:membrane protein DedA with SNARE-associated domain
MSLSDLSDTLLTAIVTYGAVALGAVVLLAALGLPLPSTVFVLASGAFIQQGVLDLTSTVVVALVCVVIGDTLSYGMGRLLRRPIHARFGRSALWQRAEHYFHRRGALAIYLTRCVLTPIAVPLNLVAGSSGYAAGRFVAFAAAGELTWLLAYGALGYAFGSQWEAVSDLIGNFSGVLAGLAIAGAGLYALIRWQRRPAPAPIAPPG